MKHPVKRFLAALLAVLALGSLPALAADVVSPKLGYTSPSGGSVTLSVVDLPEAVPVYAVQLTLELAGEVTPVFQPKDSLAYHKEQVEKAGGNTSVTIYLVSGQRPLNPSGTLVLGTLHVGADETLTIPEKATIHLLNDALSSVEGAERQEVQTTYYVPPTENGGGSGGGGGGGASKPPAQEEEPEKTALPYTDVTEKDWFYEAAQYVYNKGMMSGTTPTTFDPERATTRGMVVTILYRLEGNPVAGLSEFRDVPDHQYYARPIAWAVRSGIVSGYPNGTFAPEQPVTREQLAAILYRYAAHKGYDTTVRADLSTFADQNKISSYAVDAMAWAGGTGLINGISTTVLSPQGNATRAQTAAILMRLCENVAVKPK